MAAIVDGIYYGCKTKYVEKCVKHGIKIIELIKNHTSKLSSFVNSWIYDVKNTILN